MANEQLDSALAEYFSECDELCQRVSDHLRVIEKGGQTLETIDSLYRDIHTLKGSSQLFGFKQVGEIAHAIEASLEPVRRDQQKVSAELLETLIQGLDLVEQLVASIKEFKQERSAGEEIKILLSNLQKKASNVASPVEATSVPSATTATAPAVLNAVASASASAPAPVVAEASEGSSSIRVPVSLLDKLMNLMGEMVLVRNQVLQYATQSDHLEFLNLSQRLDVVTSEIQGEVMKTRMQPIGGILSKFHRVTRDLAKELDKKIDLQLIGVETELDKTLLEAVKDPIMHIVRNSCDHGIETIEERRKAGKNISGTIKIRSFHEGGQVIVEITDDGKGLDKNKLIAKAVEKDILTPEKATGLSERDAFGLIFAAGFSTAAVVTNVSGRGVGMDVVKNNIESIGGLVEIQSQHGFGTTTRLKIPLTLAIVPAMIVRCGLERFAIPQVKLVELLRVEEDDSNQKIEILHGKPVFRLRGSILPLLTLTEVMNLPDVVKDKNHVSNIVVLNAEGLQFGLIVDEVQDTAEVVVKPLSNFLKSLLIYSGATVLGDGSVALILDITGIAKRNNLSIETSMKVKSAAELESTVLGEEQEFLLFKLNGPAKHAIPLNLVHRLEEFRAESIEYSGKQRFVRYREIALPIISLNAYMGFELSNASGPISVIVSQKNGKLYGIEVDEIYDVLKTSSPMDDAFSDRPGIFGNLVTDNELIVVVDTLRLLDDVSAQLSAGGSVKASVTTHSQPMRGTGKILFAEDTAFFRRHVAKVLESAGYVLTLCEHGLDAYQLLERSQPGDFDLILSDIEMPKMNGMQFVAAVRGNERWKSIPMIALTTKYSAAHVEEGKKAGFDSYLEKLKPEILLNELNLLLNAAKKKGA